MSRMMGRRHRRRQRIEFARSIAHKHGRASDYLQQFANQGIPVTLFCRASSRRQESNGSLDDAIDDARRELRAMGVPANKIVLFEGVESSCIWDDRPILKDAIEHARRQRGVLVAPSRDRLLRHAEFDGTAASEMPTDAEYKELMRLADGVPLFTICHPDRESVRAGQTRRGLRSATARGVKLGRPSAKRAGYKKERRHELTPKARRLRRRGWTCRAIAKELGVPLATVHTWL